ncbi:unnamed protein product [Arabis nemorensis]|uniref:HMA domain-containing protein n=1 Tax=Arabis nemorensis TaxID=586526 RepID=A0A565BIL8_9BRAS|nr:unnamed protein product [Arabis nemorensis]
MDPVKITERLQKKSKKKIELLSPKPKKEAKVNNDTKAENQNQTMVAVSTVILKLSCSCDGCTKRIHKTISKTKGVYQLKMDKEKELVTVTGTMDVKSVTENLKRRLKKSVLVVPEKKKNNTEGITKVGSPGLPGYGLGHYGFMDGRFGEFFSEEDENFCSVM